jgi:ribosomal protein S6
MNLYELTYLISPKMANEQAKEFSKKQSQMLKDLGATLYKIEDPKKITLSYPIEGFKEAYLTSTDLDITSEKVKLIEEKLKREDDILRFLIISKDKIEENEEDEKMNKESEEKKDTKKEKSKKTEEKETKEDEKKEKAKDKKKEDDGKEEEEKKKKIKKSKKEKKVKLNEIDEKIDEIL